MIGKEYYSVLDVGTYKKWRSEQIVSFIFNDEAGKKECCCGTSFV
jgi:hypothetical protein